MDIPNLPQIAGQLRTALAAGGPIAAVVLSKTGWSQADYAGYLELFLYVAPPVIAAVWSYLAKRDASLVVAASKVEGATVVADRTASPEVKAVAASDAVLVAAASKVEGATVVVDTTAAAAVQEVAKTDNTAPGVVTEKAFLEQKAM